MKALRNRWQAWVATALGALSLLPSATFAQASDFPTFKGDAARTGRNGNPNLVNPGVANLRWFTPFGTEDTTVVTVDNTDEQDAFNFVDTGSEPRAYPGGPYDRNPYGFTVTAPKYQPQRAIGAYNPRTEWCPPTEGGEASFNFTAARRLNPVILGGVTYGEDFAIRTPSYLFTRATASQVGADPVLAVNSRDRRAVEWRLGGPVRTLRYYALYVNIPVGPTTLPTGELIFPQRYYVYDITFGDNQRYIDVVDTYATGGGWVRLGAGGAPTNAVFPYSGATSVRIRLYNTMPRDAAGQLTMPGANNENANASNYVVYADAARAIPVGGYYRSTPVVAGFGTSEIRVVGARTDVAAERSASSTELEIRNQSVVSAYRHDFGGADLFDNLAWSFSPAPNQLAEGNLDDDSPSVSKDASFTQVNEPTFINGGLHVAPITSDLANVVRATYEPSLSDGDYEVYAYLRGSTGTLRFGNRVRYEIREGDTVSIVEVNQDARSGWFRIGARRYRHRNGTTATQPTPQRLSVSVTNGSLGASDQTRQAMADAIRFVGQGGTAIHSTPTMANARIRLSSGNVESRRVVVTADESGRIYCMDARGLSDRTTAVYWAYPSVRRSTTYIDPNLSEGIDGPNSPAPTTDSIPTAEMPSGFDTSSALIQRIAGEDYLFIASRNGRVYCLAMDGRGDFNGSDRLPGTTRRIWTFPDDFPGTRRRGTLGEAAGTIAFAVVGGRASIIVPTREGRVYALEALPTDAANVANRTTNVRWVYPSQDQPPLGQITMTPAVEFDKVYVGARQTTDALVRFHALNVNTGQPEWLFPNTADWNNGNPSEARHRTTSWISSPATVPASVVGGGMPNTVYVLNENRYLFALNADTGAELWNTAEINAGSKAALTFTFLNTFNTAGGRTLSPVVTVPTNTGRFVAVFARTAELNRFGTRRAWEYVAAGETIDSSMSVGNGFMYGADSAGFLYAFNDSTGVPITPGFQPGQESIVENDSRGQMFRRTRVGLVNKAAYDRLRLAPSDPNHLRYEDLIDPATQLIRPAFTVTRDPLAFEWGETAYFLAYGFPFLTTNQANGNRVPPPVINFSTSVEGTANRAVNVETRQFRLPTTSPSITDDVTGNVINDTQTGQPLRQDGYAVLAFTFSGGGPNALPPGNVRVATTLSSQALTSAQNLVQVALNPATTTFSYVLANPLAVWIPDAAPASTVAPTASNTGIGLSRVPSDPENVVNGSPNVAATGSKDESKLLASTGFGQHGQASLTRVYIVDRSMMGLLRPDGTGLDNVRVDRNGLAWQGRDATVHFKRLDPALYPGFEDLPTTIPNRSVDYPDIRPEALRVTKDPNGRAENPIFNTAGVSLYAPRINQGGGLRPLQPGDNPEDRVFIVTPFEFEVNVPRFQPPNIGAIRYNGANLGTAGVPGDPRQLMVNSAGAILPQGYIGQMRVYVDSAQNGQWEQGREAFRAFSISTGVLADEKLRVITPTVDASSNESVVEVGSLPNGAGKVLTAGGYGPNTARFGPTFRPFTVLNEGNVNMLNVRPAKTSRLTAAPAVPFAFESRTNDLQAWLDSSLDLWANFDATFAPVYGGVNRQIIQKPRVGDSVPTQLVVNPTRRENANLGVVASSLIPGAPSTSPTVSVTVPIGFPSGTYSQVVRVIENSSVTDPRPEQWETIPNTNLRLIESYTDPSFRLIFKVRESRLTNQATRYADPQIDNLIDESAALAYKNTQPSLTRDLAGNTVLAWASNRPVDTPFPGAPPSVLVNEPYRLYFAGLGSGASFTQTGLSTPGGFSAIRDLNFWNPANPNAWWRKSPSSTQGYPGPGTNFGALFGLAASPDASRMRFLHPSFPATGFGNPADPTNISTAFSSGLMAFVGEINDPNTFRSRIFVAPVTSPGGNVSVGDPIPLPFDDGSRKGKPAIIQTGPSSAIVFYPSTNGNFTSLMVATLNASVQPETGSRWSRPVALNFGASFESITGVSSVMRFYRRSQPMVELVLTGRARGQANTETFLTRLALTGTPATLPVVDGSLTPAAMAYPFLNRVEAPVSLGNGVYRATGVMWDIRSAIDLTMTVNGATATVLRPGTRSVDPQTTVISFDTTLGGRVFLDPRNGRIRFSNGTPPRNAVLSLTHTPFAIRLSENTVSYNSPSVAYDMHKNSDIAWWNNGDWGNFNQRNDRLFFTYGRDGGSGQAPRPAYKTYRFGLRLPFNYAVNDGGYPVSVTVTGLSGQYMVDPSTRAVYVTDVDENRQITVTYQARIPDNGTGTVQTVTTTGTVGLIEEVAESLVPIEQAVNESGMTTFLDPFDPRSTNPNLRRPSLFWMVWTSTRSGAPDLYLQGFAPRLNPVGSGR
jgi:hypothetical protein